MSDCPICHGIEKTLCYGCLRDRAEKAEAERDKLVEQRDSLLKDVNDMMTRYAEMREALGIIASYGKDGICPYGCDTPNIARNALDGVQGDREAGCTHVYFRNPVFGEICSMCGAKRSDTE